MSKWILGLGLSHDASACLLQDGNPIVGIQLERLTGRKHDGRKELAHMMIDYCLEQQGITWEDLAVIGVSLPDVHVPSDMKLQRFDSSASNVLHVGHHLAHAYSAFVPSPFSQASVLVIDGHGDSYYESHEDRYTWGPELWRELEAEESLNRRLDIAPRTEVESLYIFNRLGTPRLVKRNFMGYGRRANRHRGQYVNVGIGANYKFASSVLFGHGDHSGKVMGLAPYGTPRNDLPKSYWLDADGDFVLDDRWRHQVRQEVHDKPDLPKDHQWAANLAAYIQRETEEVVTLLATRATATLPQLCIAGGVALNATTNGVLERDRGIDLYVQPASSDAGLSLGAAFAAYHASHGNITQTRQRFTDSLGRTYSPSEIEHAIASQPLVRRDTTLDNIDALAAALANGATVGWFEGGSEFGPRALGHRSILADARDPAMRDRINLQIKEREWFRPFGPVVLAEEASSWFAHQGCSHTMTSTTFVAERMKRIVPAVVHIDGSARVQLLEKENSSYRRLLETFARVTGTPVLVNTSFNVRDRPIVETPRDAVLAFLDLGLDILWMEGKAVVRR